MIARRTVRNAARGVARCTAVKRRWTIPVTRTPDGEKAWLVIAVAPDGTIMTQVGTSHLRFVPEELSQLRKAFHEAQAVALQERGAW